MSKESTVNQGQETSLNIDPNLSKGDVLKRYTENKYKHYLYGVVSFIMTAMFYVSFTSPDWVQRVVGGSGGDAIGAGVWAFAGLLFSIVITVLIMHSHTTDHKQWKYSAYALILILGMSFNVFTETASTMDRVDERVVVKSESSALFQTLNNSIAASTQQVQGSTGLESKLAKAEVRLARCYENLKAGKEKHCRGDKAKVTSLKASIADARSAGVANTTALIEKAKDASRNEDYAQMVIKMTMQALGVSFLIATGLVSLFIIATFEILGIMIGSDYRRYRDALPRYGIDLHRGNEIKYLKADLKRQNERDAAINQYNIDQGKMKLKRMTEAKKEKEQITKLQEQIRKYSSGAYAESSPIPENAATAKREESPAPETNNEPVKSEQPIPEKQDNSVGFELPKQAPSTAEKNRRKRAENSVLKQAQSKAKTSPIHDTELKTSNSQENQTVTSVLKQDQNKPSVLAQGATFKTSSKQAEKQPKNEAKNSVLKQAPKQEEREFFSDTDLIYPEWKKAVQEGHCKLTARSCRDWVKKHLGANTSRQVKKITESYASQISELCYMRGLNDDVIIQNPKWKDGSRIQKYLIA